ncbi:MAG TPA: ImmA/IrrE family metallo-endopeptidase [Candidatus Acetothermia bacterium]|nr:ImmA/IrrE family metallo-endopeptidase [Candidatus Acetothermia bacterium]
MAVQGGMLRLARQRLRLTQKEAAKRLGIRQPILSRYENATIEADDEFAGRAAQVYGVPIGFLEQLDPIYGPPVSVHPMTRKKSNVTARELDAIMAELNIRTMHIRRLLEGVEFTPTSDVPQLDIDQYESPASVAGLLRAHWGVPSGPIHDLTALVEKAGTIIVLSPLGNASVSGVTYKVPGQPPLIALADHQPADRLRFTLAHELGHLVMHRFPTSEMEDEANAFAAAFLMPEQDIRPSFAGRRIDLALLASLKPEWKVAMQALLVRASSLGYLKPNQSRYLWQQISARGMRLKEPPELDFPHEEPQIMSLIIGGHLEDLGYSIEEIAELLNLHTDQIRDLYRLWEKPIPPERPRLRIVK